MFEGLFYLALFYFIPVICLGLFAHFYKPGCPQVDDIRSRTLLDDDGNEYIFEKNGNKKYRKGA